MSKIKPAEHGGSVRFLAKPKPTPNHVDKTFIGYGGNPKAVDNWQAIALTAIDVFSQWGFGYRRLKSKDTPR